MKLSFTLADGWRQNARTARLSADASRATASILSAQGFPVQASEKLREAEAAEARVKDYEERARLADLRDELCELTITLTQKLEAEAGSLSASIARRQAMSALDALAVGDMAEFDRQRMAALKSLESAHAALTSAAPARRPEPAEQREAA